MNIQQKPPSNTKRSSIMGYPQLIAHRLLLPLSALLLAPSPAMADGPDLAREQRLAEQSVDAILDGEPVYLTTSDNTRFLAIEMGADAEPQHGAATILHDRGMHPDWSQIAAPLRNGLPSHGWSTLSLQMPVRVKDAKTKISRKTPSFPHDIQGVQVPREGRISAAARRESIQNWNPVSVDSPAFARMTIGFFYISALTAVPLTLPGLFATCCMNPVVQTLMTRRA
jgi:hypothetical protein